MAIEFLPESLARVIEGGGQMRQANALGIPHAVILGDDEIQRGEVVVRDMRASTQETNPMQLFLDGAAADKEWFPWSLMLAPSVPGDLPRPAEVTRNGRGVVGRL